MHGIEAMKPSSEAPNLKLRNKIKEKIFNIYDFDDTNVALFCDFMQFYELDSNIPVSYTHLTLPTICSV